MKILLRFSPLLILIGAIIATHSYGLHEYLSLESIKAQKEEFQSMIEAAPILSAFLFILFYTACVALLLPIATLLTLLGGFLFGLIQGTLLVVTGATLGATIVFLIAKTSMGTTLREKAGPFYTKIESNMKDNAVGYLLFMRFVPLFPIADIQVYQINIL